MNTDIIELGRRLKGLREKTGLTQKEVATEINQKSIEQNTVARAEQGKGKMETTLLLINFYSNKVIPFPYEIFGSYGTTSQSVIANKLLKVRQQLGDLIIKIDEIIST